MLKRVTIKTIAEDLGISHMTVSRALSGNPKVRKSTRDQIIKRAGELGYVKSVAAAIMRGDRTTTVGLLLPNLINEFYARFANMLANSLENAGLQLIIHLTNDDPSKERLALLKLKEIQARSVVMVPTVGLKDLEEKLLQDMNIIQLIRNTKTCFPSQAILLNDQKAFIDAVKYLADKNHKKIAYLGGNTTLSTGATRMSAFKIGLEEAGIRPVTNLIITGEPSYEMGHQATLNLIERGNVTAIICGGVEISNGALNGCLESGKKIPQDIAFIGYGDPSYYQWIEGGISTIHLPVDYLAKSVSDMIRNIGPAEIADQNPMLFNAKLLIR